MSTLTPQEKNELAVKILELAQDLDGILLSQIKTRALIKSKASISDADLTPVLNVLIEQQYLRVDRSDTELKFFAQDPETAKKFSTMDANDKSVYN
jgi:hypothetical protein